MDESAEVLGSWLVLEDEVVGSEVVDEEVDEEVVEG